MNKISMRRAQPSDVPALMDLLRQVNEVHFRGRPDLFRRATKYSADDVSATMSDDDRPIFVATDGSRVLAHIFCQVRDYRPNPLLQDLRPCTSMMYASAIPREAWGLGVLLWIGFLIGRATRAFIM